MVAVLRRRRSIPTGRTLLCVRAMARLRRGHAWVVDTGGRPLERVPSNHALCGAFPPFLSERKQVGCAGGMTLMRTGSVVAAARPARRAPPGGGGGGARAPEGAAG